MYNCNLCADFYEAIKEAYTATKEHWSLNSTFLIFIILFFTSSKRFCLNMCSTCSQDYIIFIDTIMSPKEKISCALPDM